MLEIQEKTADHHQGLNGSIRISTPEGFGNYFLAERVGKFTQDNPLISVELVTIQQILALSRREADIAITMTEPPRDLSMQEHLVDYSLGLYASTDYLSIAAPIFSRTDLIDHPFVGYVNDLIFSRPLDYLREIHPGLRSRLQNSSIEAQKLAIESSFGIGVLPLYIGRTSSKLVRLLPDEVSLRRTYWIVTVPEVADTAVVRSFLRFIRAIVQDSRDFFAS
ncbi:hypothetical protein GCM10007913_40340 [Devosia yakushimensis]|uniref:LysR substrate-binding domain-containing protein n=1 Tax=Devosia yakushimensis TaxID=470028 RepID=A0ABQ5UL69_9HYPH|nr:hypothetical protein GCM10007913_40340 [Devosia yakushimensis]